MNKTIAFALLALAVIAGAWFIFSPQPEKFENDQNGQIGQTASSTGLSGSSYSSQAFGFQVQVPPNFTVDESYLNQDLGPGREIPGVAFRIPASLSDGTNLSSDSYVAVEELSDVECTPETFLLSPTGEASATIGGKAFAKAFSSDAAAGNRYDQAVYVTEKGSRCYAVRQFVHYGNIANYPAGAVREFDKAPLDAAFNSIASSLTIY